MSMKLTKKVCDKLDILFDETYTYLIEQDWYKAIDAELCIKVFYDRVSCDDLIDLIDAGIDLPDDEDDKQELFHEFANDFANIVMGPLPAKLPSCRSLYTS